MADDSINDFLLDQELEGEPGTENDLPDDIDAILDAVEEEDLNLTEPSIEISENAAFSDETALLDEAIDAGESVVTEPDLEKELDIRTQANPDSMDIPIAQDSDGLADGGDNIPLISDVIDPNAPGNSAEMNDNLSFELMTKIQTVVEQAISKEVGRITTSLRDNVLDEVKNQLPAVISRVLKKSK